MVETFLSGAAENEIAVGLVERKMVVASYPESVRTWLKFFYGAFSGANLFALRGANASRALKLWARAEQEPKHQAKLLWRFGPWLTVRAATRTIGFDAAPRWAGRNLDLSAAAVQLPFAKGSYRRHIPSRSGTMPTATASRAETTEAASRATRASRCSSSSRGSTRSRFQWGARSSTWPSS